MRPARMSLTSVRQRDMGLTERRRRDVFERRRRVEAQRAVDQMVQRVDGDEVRLAVRVRRRRAAAERDRRTMLGEFMRRFVNQVSRDANPARDGVRGVSVQRRAVAARERVHRRRFAHAVRRYHLRHAEREQPFGPRLYGNPLVGVRRRHRKARIDVIMRPALAVDALPKLAVAARVANGRPPSVQEIRAERQDEVGGGEVEVRHPVLPEHGLDGAFQVGFLQRLERGRMSRRKRPRSCGRRIRDARPSGLWTRERAAVCFRSGYSAG